MTLFVSTDGNFTVITYGELLAQYPLTSFPPEWSISNGTVEEYGYAIVEYDQAPPLELLQKLDFGPWRVETGHYYRTWIVIDPVPQDFIDYYSPEVDRLAKLSNVQVTALQGRVDAIKDAIDFGIETPEEVAELPIREAELREWKLYRIYVGRIKTQAGWAMDIIWPVQPPFYMNELSYASNEAQ